MIKHCLNCDNLYNIRPSRADKSSYCSIPCKGAHQKTALCGENNPNYRNAGFRICLTCKREFTHYLKTRKYCSDKCKGNAPENMARIRALCYKGGLITIECATCGTPFQAKPSAHRRFCCYPCAKENIMRRKLASIDRNHTEIVKMLRDAGASVMDTSDIGNGFPDLVVGFRGGVYLLEVKNLETYYGRKGLNKNQLRWNDEWKGAPMVVVRTPDEALKAIGAL